MESVGTLVYPVRWPCLPGLQIHHGAPPLWLYAVTYQTLLTWEEIKEYRPRLFSCLLSGCSWWLCSGCCFPSPEKQEARLYSVRTVASLHKRKELWESYKCSDQPCTLQVPTCNIFLCDFSPMLLPLWDIELWYSVSQLRTDASRKVLGAYLSDSSQTQMGLIHLNNVSTTN